MALLDLLGLVELVVTVELVAPHRSEPSHMRTVVAVALVVWVP